jgi:hypothetical protein
VVLALVLIWLHTDISIAPSAIYNFNQYFAMGAGIQYTYSRQRNFTTLIYTVVASPFNPIPEIQLSAELEQLRVNVSGTGQNNFSDNFWNTGFS